MATDTLDGRRVAYFCHRARSTIRAESRQLRRSSPTLFPGDGRDGTPGDNGWLLPVLDNQRSRPRCPRQEEEPHQVLHGFSPGDALCIQQRPRRRRCEMCRYFNSAGLAYSQRPLARCNPLRAAGLVMLLKSGGLPCPVLLHPSTHLDGLRDGPSARGGGYLLMRLADSSAAAWISSAIWCWSLLLSARWRLMAATVVLWVLASCLMAPSAAISMKRVDARKSVAV